jgi:hypothetical protein
MKALYDLSPQTQASSILAGRDWRQFNTKLPWDNFAIPIEKLPFTVTMPVDCFQPPLLDCQFCHLSTIEMHLELLPKRPCYCNSARHRRCIIWLCRPLQGLNKTNIRMQLVENANDRIRRPMWPIILPKSEKKNVQFDTYGWH